MLSTNELVLINLTLSAVLTGLIWTIQVVHYPGFLGVGNEGFLAYQHQHMRTISYVVMPLMLGELAATIFLLLRHSAPDNVEIYVATAMVIVIWATTMFVSSPLHGKLASQGYNVEIIKRLVTTNWIRTAAWSIRTGVLLLVAWQIMKR